MLVRMWCVTETSSNTCMIESQKWRVIAPMVILGICSTTSMYMSHLHMSVEFRG